MGEEKGKGGRLAAANHTGAAGLLRAPLLQWYYYYSYYSYYSYYCVAPSYC